LKKWYTTQRREVSLASAYCRGFFVFWVGKKEKSFNAEFAEETQRAQSFGRGEEE